MASGFELDAARGRVEQAHLAPNPQLTVAKKMWWGPMHLAGLKAQKLQSVSAGLLNVAFESGVLMQRLLANH